MQLQALLESKRSEIIERWADLALAVYPQGADSFIGREKDRFRNPVGHTTGENLKQLFEALLAGQPAGELAEPIDGIVRIRAIQELSPTQAVGFVFLLKRAIHEQLGEAATDPVYRADLSALHDRIDQMALVAFERYARCRDAIHELRAREAKRNTWSLLKRLERLPASGEATHRSKGGDEG